MEYLIELKQTISTVKGHKLKLDTINQINELTNHLECKSLKERIFCILNNITELSQKPKCKCCHKPTKFNDDTVKYLEFCSRECKTIFNRKTKEQERLEKLSNTQNYIECKVCGEPVKALAAHLAFKKDRLHDNWDLERYKKEFPGEPTVCNSYVNGLKEKMKGENNHMHRNNTTLKQRQSSSPFSKEFYLKRGFNEIEAERMAKEKGIDAIKDRVGATSLDYFLEKSGGDLEKAKILQKERQSTFTLEKCIKKYGKEEGTKRFNERQEKWSTKMETMYKEGKFTKYNNNFHSTNSIELFKNLPQENAYHSNNEYWINDGHRIFYYDYRLGKKLIEFNGDYWHCNPEVYKEDYFHKRKNKTAKELWEFDEYKVNLAKSKGYEVLIIWEKDWNSDKQGTIKKCLDFLNS